MRHSAWYVQCTTVQYNAINLSKDQLAEHALNKDKDKNKEAFKNKFMKKHILRENVNRTFRIM